MWCLQAEKVKHDSCQLWFPPDPDPPQTHEPRVDPEMFKLQLIPNMALLKRVMKWDTRSVSVIRWVNCPLRSDHTLLFLQSSSQELQVKGRLVRKERAWSDTGREERECVCVLYVWRSLCMRASGETHTLTDFAYDITACGAVGRNVTEKGALWRRGKRREGRKRRRRRGGKGLAREKSGTPTGTGRTKAGLKWTQLK